MKVNPLDLKAQYKTIRDEILKAVQKVCDSQWCVLGENVSGLEAEVAAFTNSPHGIGVASGTDALLLSLMAMGVGPGDSVITTPYTFFSTAGSIARLGAKTIFVDIDPLTYNINPGALSAELDKRVKAGEKVKAIIPVHLYGQCADMGPIMATARKHGARVVEDACQAIGATHKGKQAGSIGDTGCFSFYPSKNIGGLGDGGMVTARTKKTAELVRMLRVHGCKDRYYHKYVGINSRLDEIQAAALRVKLKYIEDWTAAREACAALYEGLFEKAGLTDIVRLPAATPGSRHVYNQYVVSVEKKRDALKDYLAKEGVGSAIYYPVPLHLQECFKELGYRKGSMPVSERAAKETLALPIYPELSAAKQRYVVKSVAAFFSKAG